MPSFGTITIPPRSPRLSISHLRACGQERGHSPYTIQGQARTLKILFRFAQEEGYLETNIATRLKVPRAPKKIIQTFSEEQLRQLLASARSVRDKAILGLFIDTGIRVTELASLRIHDVNLDRGRVKVHGKGVKERFVFFGNRCRRLLWRYINTERLNISSDRLFINSHGQPLKARGILKMVWKACRNQRGPLFPSHSPTYLRQAVPVERRGDTLLFAHKRWEGSIAPTARLTN